MKTTRALNFHGKNRLEICMGICAYPQLSLTIKSRFVPYIHAYVFIPRLISIESNESNKLFFRCRDLDRLVVRLAYFVTCNLFVHGLGDGRSIIT